MFTFRFLNRNVVTIQELPKKLFFRLTFIGKVCGRSVYNVIERENNIMVGVMVKEAK
jgi:hypothetical protein